AVVTSLGPEAHGVEFGGREEEEV
ncbi:MAG: hypothetical protein QOH78_424, partial [Verrucomicrobiota bacterium]